MTEFNYRGWEPEAPREDGSFAPRPTLMGWHPDGVPGPGGTLEARAARVPYGVPDLLSTFTYAQDSPLAFFCQSLFDIHHSKSKPALSPPSVQR